MRKNLKLSIVIKNAVGSEDTLMHKAERPSNYFFSTLSHIIRLSSKERCNLCPDVVGNTPY